MTRSKRLALTLALLIGTLPGSANAGEAPYRAEPSIPLSDGRWDLASFDAARGQVIIARSDNVSLADVTKGTARDIGAIAHGHAALATPGTNLIAVTSGQDDTVRLLDVADGHETARIAVGKDPDAALWDAASARLIVMNAKGGTISVIDPVKASVVRTITVKPALELGVMAGPNLLAVNDEDANELELVDLAKGVALKPVALTGCEGPTGLAIALAAKLALSSCGNGKAALVDLRAHKLIRLLPIGQGPDTVLFDPVRHRFLIPCGRSGTMNVFAVDKHGMVSEMASVTTETSARTGTIDEATGRVYLPSAKYKPAEAGKRPEMIPGSAHLLVLSPAS